MSELSDLLNHANVQGWSNREIGRRAGISSAAVNSYMNGTHGRPTEPNLEKFSHVFNIPIERLREASGHPAGERKPYKPPSEANRLGARERKAIDELIRLLANKEISHVEQLNPVRTSSESGASGESNETQEAGLTDDPEVPDRAVTAARGAARRARKASEIQRKRS